MTTRQFKQRFVFTYLVIAIIMIILLPAISLAQADKIFRENNKAVVVVIAYDDKGKAISQGSGFIVREDGALVTNSHVVSNAVDVRVKVEHKFLKVEGLLHSDQEHDLVILKVKAEKLSAVKIANIEQLTIGEKVYVISSPEGFENTISDGILSGIRAIDPKTKILQITAPVSEGSSGGPVFNKNGEVIGIATFLMEGAQNLNFAMSIDLIKDKLSIRKVIALKDAEIQTHSVAIAQGEVKNEVKNKEEWMKECTSQINERTAALVVRDWTQLERLAKRFLQDCKGIIDTELYSSAYSDIAETNLQLSNPKAALAVSEKCIDLFYANSYCHLNKVRAFIKLKRFAEARTEFDIAEKLIGYLIQKTERELLEASHPVYKDLYSSKLLSLKAQRSHLDSIRSLID